jgi:hypothetical protein
MTQVCSKIIGFEAQLSHIDKNRTRASYNQADSLQLNGLK